MTRLHYAFRLGSLLCALALPSMADAGDVLHVLAWPGYADADVVRAFEQRSGKKVEVSVVDSDEALWEKINAGAAKNPQTEVFDVFAVNTADLPRYRDQGLVRPLRLTAMPNLSRLLARFRDFGSLPGVARGAEVFGIPYAYAAMGLIYDRTQLAEPPRHISALWDARFRGRVLVYRGGVHNFSLAAQSLGLPDPYHLQEKDWPAVVERLVELRRNVLAFYAQPDESVAGFRQRSATLMLANYGSQQFQLLQKAGANVGYVIPEEGALAWLDCWVVTRASKQPELAEAWINYLLEESPGKILQDRQGLSNTTAPSPYLAADARLLWLEPVEDSARRNQLWERIDSGYSAKKVLQP